MIDRDRRVVYSINLVDIQQVAGEVIDRELTKHEIDLVEDKLGEFVDWYGAIQNTIDYCELPRKRSR